MLQVTDSLTARWRRASSSAAPRGRPERPAAPAAHSQPSRICPTHLLEVSDLLGELVIEESVRICLRALDLQG